MKKPRPQTFRREEAPDLADAIGPEAARLLLAHFAGRRIYVPKSAGDSHPIAAVLGPEIAAQLYRRFGGEELYFPMTYGRRQRILDLSSMGRAPSAIAAEEKVSIRHVYDVLAEAREGLQLKLF